jgi:hypothetical protein
MPIVIFIKVVRALKFKIIRNIKNQTNMIKTIGKYFEAVQDKLKSSKKFSITFIYQDSI